MDEMPPSKGMVTKGMDEAILKYDVSDCESNGNNDNLNGLSCNLNNSLNISANNGLDLSGNNSMSNLNGLSSNSNNSFNISENNGLDLSGNNSINDSFDFSGQYLSQDKNITFDSSGNKFDNTIASLASINETGAESAAESSDSSSGISSTQTKSNINRFRKLAATPRTQKSSLEKESINNTQNSNKLGSNAVDKDDESNVRKNGTSSVNNIDRF